MTHKKLTAVISELIWDHDALRDNPAREPDGVPGPVAAELEGGAHGLGGVGPVEIVGAGNHPDIVLDVLSLAYLFPLVCELGVDFLAF